jgi:large subunit ribosomal protein L25
MSAIIQAITRQQMGTGASRSIRREGLVPGVLYGGKVAPTAIAVAAKTLVTEMHDSHFFSKVFTIEINNQRETVIAKALQLDPVTDTPIHVDFQRVDQDSTIRVLVPLVFTHEEKSPGIKRGGVLNVIVHSLEVVCSVNAIPEQFVVSLAGLELNHSVHLDAIELDKKVTIAHPERDNTLATIVAPSGLVEEKPTAAAE